MLSNRIGECSLCGVNTPNPCVYQGRKSRSADSCNRNNSASRVEVDKIETMRQLLNPELPKKDLPQLFKVLFGLTKPKTGK